MSERGLLSEEQREFIGICRHCGESMWRINGKVVVRAFQDLCARHELERRKRHYLREDVNKIVESLFDIVREG